MRHWGDRTIEFGIRDGGARMERPHVEIVAMVREQHGYPPTVARCGLEFEV
jgi:hypothetical protein